MATDKKINEIVHGILQDNHVKCLAAQSIQVIEKFDAKSTNYLTEARLGEILGDIFGHGNVKGQVPVFGKKVDWVVTVGFDCQLRPVKEAKTCLIDYRRCACEGCDIEGENKCHDCIYQSSLQDVKVRLVVEFDGNRHYQSNESVFRDSFIDNCRYNFDVDWVYEVESDMVTAWLRLPYWLQMDGTVTERLFGVNRDFSNGFPHGFISNKCVLPNVFSADGESRFILELASIPLEVQVQVIVSLFIKGGYGRNCKSGSCNLWSIVTGEDWPGGLALHQYLGEVHGEKTGGCPKFDRELSQTWSPSEF